MRTDKTKNKEKETSYSQIEKFHPYKTFMFFGLLGSTLVFLAVSFLYIVTITKSTDLKSFHLPKSFFLSTILLMASSFTISKAVRAFENDSFNELIKSLLFTLVLSICFSVCQVLGWKTMYDAGFFLSTQVGVSYLYVISGFHLLHVVAGVSFITHLTFKSYNKSQDMVDSLLFFSDQSQKIKIELITIFWHFVDFIWLCLFFMFLFTF